jgi:putative oxidoreductase
MSNVTLDTPVARAERTGIDTALLLARIALALPFVFHGASIAFGAFGGPGLQGFSGFTHMPLAMAVLVGYGEFLGGLGILFGVLSRIAGAGMVLIMLGAIGLVHLKNGYDGTKNGFEHPLTLLILALAILAAGPGRLALGRLLPLPKRAGTDEPVPALE